MPKFEALYYPTFEPPVIWLRSFLLFFDKIRTIVPTDVNFKLSNNIAELVGLLPGTFETIPPKEQDTIIDDLNLDRMRKAFQIIKEKEPTTKEKEFKITIDKRDESIGIAGYTLLHHRKLSDKVRSLLEEFKLIEPEFSNLVESLSTDARNFSIVNESAGDLIVSHIADKIAKQYGWNTVTDLQIDFSVNALNAFEHESIKEPRNMLVCSIIKCEIPQEIQYINPKKYVEFRDVYSDIRKPFHRFVNELSNLYRLETISDKQILQDRIREITHEFDLEVEKFKKTKFGRIIKRWISIGIGSLAILTGAVINEATVKITCAAVSVAMQIIQKSSTCKEPEPERSKIQRLIARMQKDILKASQIRKLC